MLTKSRVRIAFGHTDVCGIKMRVNVIVMCNVKFNEFRGVRPLHMSSIDIPTPFVAGRNDAMEDHGKEMQPTSPSVGHGEAHDTHSPHEVPHQEAESVRKSKISMYSINHL